MTAVPLLIDTLSVPCYGVLASGLETEPRGML